MKKIDELKQILEDYPDTIPVRVAADFLGIGERGLVSAISEGQYSWALSWANNKIVKGNGVMPGRRQTRIMAVPFAVWYTGGNLAMVM